MNLIEISNTVEGEVLINADNILSVKNIESCMSGDDVFGLLINDTKIFFDEEKARDTCYEAIKKAMQGYRGVEFFYKHDFEKNIDYPTYYYDD